MAMNKPSEIANQFSSLKGTEELLCRAFSSAANSVFITDGAGKIVWVNDAFVRLTGYSAEEAIGSTPSILKSGKQSNEFYMDLWQSIISGHVWRGMMIDRRKDNSLFSIDQIITPLTDKSGKITHYISVQHDMTLRSQEDERNYYFAYHDSLTGLANRTLFLEALKKTIHKMQRSQKIFAVIFIDLDNFKPINDKFGHAVGDQLLTAVGERLRSAVRKLDVVARFGGDEFAILVNEIHDIETAITLANKLLDTLSQRFSMGKHTIHLHASVGISVYPVNGTDADSLLFAADEAMYQAKKAGGQRYSVYDTPIQEGH